MPLSLVFTTHLSGIPLDPSEAYTCPAFIRYASGLPFSAWTREFMAGPISKIPLPSELEEELVRHLAS